MNDENLLIIDETILGYICQKDVVSRIINIFTIKFLYCVTGE